MSENKSLQSSSPENDPARQEALSSLYEAMLTRKQKAQQSIGVWIRDKTDPDLVTWFISFKDSTRDPFKRTNLPYVAQLGQTRLDGGAPINCNLFFDGKTFDFIGEEEHHFSSLTSDDIHPNMSQGQTEYIMKTILSDAEQEKEHIKEMLETEDGRKALEMESLMMDKSLTHYIESLTSSIEAGELMFSFENTDSDEISLN